MMNDQEMLLIKGMMSFDKECTLLMMYLQYDAKIDPRHRQ